MSQLRLLLLTDSDAFAGTERHMLDLAVALRGLGEVVAIGCPAETPLDARARGEGVPVIAVARRGGVDLGVVRQLAGLLRGGEFDVIHAHNGRSTLQATLARTLARRGQVVATQHFLEPRHAGDRGLKGAATAALHHWMIGRCARVIAISSAVRQSMLQRGEVDEAKCPVVFNGIRDPQRKAQDVGAVARRSLAIADDTVLLVCAARLETEKEIATLIEAIGSLPAEAKVACVIAGEGSQQATLEAMAESEPHGRVRLLGFRDDVHDLIAAADVFVLPAPAEPFGLVLLEAMAMSRPVIAAEAGGPLDVVVDGVTGRFFEPGNSRSLAERLLELVQDAGRRAAMGCAGRERYEQYFTADRMAGEMLGVYRLVTGGDPVDSHGGIPATAANQASVRAELP